MNEWKRLKAAYDAAEIPQDLDMHVRAGIHLGGGKRRRHIRRMKLLHVSETMAACFAALFVVLNVSPTIAAAAGDIPVLGRLLRVLTVRSMHELNNDVSYEIDVPGIQNGSDYTDRINDEIQKRVDKKIEEGNQAVLDYKKAFIETGGTQQQWDARENKVSVTYNVKSQTDTRVSFVIKSFVSTASAYQEEFFYNLDLLNNRVITLKDLYGDNWVNICNRSILNQITDYPLSPGEKSPFFGADMGGFSTVDEKTNFYINEKGNAVIVFPRASIAIGALGSVEFVVTE